MDDAPAEARLPPGLRFLKALVIALTLTLIAGVITIVGLLVTRLQPLREAPAWPPALDLPGGAVPAAVTQGAGWFAVVTTDGRILIFGADGRLRQEVAVGPAR